jgi:hypothetical protein
MKRSLVAIGLTLVGLNANAVELYSFDGATVELTGQAEVQYLEPQERNSRAKIDVIESSIGVTTSQEINENWIAGGTISVDGTGSTAKVGDLYVYFSTSDGSYFSIGKQKTTYDSAGIGSDYAFGFTGYTVNLATKSDQVIKYQYDGGEIFFAGASAVLYSNEDGTTHDSNDYQYDGRIGARFGDLSTVLYGATSQTLSNIENTLTFEARYNYGPIAYAISYGLSDAETNTNDLNNTFFGAAVTLDNGGRWTYGLGIANVDNESNTDSINDFYINASYYILDNVTAYVELGLTDEDSKGAGMAVGMNVNF